MSKNWIFRTRRDGASAPDSFHDVAERCGMTRRETGIRRYYGMDMPHYLYSIRREEWEK